MELKLRHVLSILRALDVAPSVFFSTLYPEGRDPSDAVVMEEFLRRFEKLGLGARPAVAPAVLPMDPQQLQDLVREAVRTALAERDGRQER
jgi:hypothetical protein